MGSSSGTLCSMGSSTQSNQTPWALAGGLSKIRPPLPQPLAGILQLGSCQDWPSHLKWRGKTKHFSSDFALPILIFLFKSNKWGLGPLLIVTLGPKCLTSTCWCKQPESCINNISQTRWIGLLFFFVSKATMSWVYISLEYHQFLPNGDWVRPRNCLGENYKRLAYCLCFSTV